MSTKTKKTADSGIDSILWPREMLKKGEELGIATDEFFKALTWFHCIFLALQGQVEQGYGKHTGRETMRSGAENDHEVVRSGPSPWVWWTVWSSMLNPPF